MRVLFEVVDVCGVQLEQGQDAVDQQNVKLREQEIEGLLFAADIQNGYDVDAQLLVIGDVLRVEDGFHKHGEESVQILEVDGAALFVQLEHLG